jgi:hypothetical protein
MPSIAKFLGIVIAIYYKEHNPPHFHVKYNEYKAVFTILDLTLIEGELPPRVVSIVLEWAFQNRNELMEDWALAMNKKALKPIKPLV